MRQKAESLGEQAKTVIWVSQSNRVVGLIAVADSVRPEAAATISSLHSMGIETSMLTGDNAHTASAVAQQIGIADVIANVLPQDKTAKIKQLQDAGGVVAMVGDGINDAPALAQSNVGIAIGTGADVAIDAADVTLLGSDLSAVNRAISLSTLTMRNIKQNLFWAFAYNVALIPVAAGILAGFETVPHWLRQLHPITAALAMVGSDLVIVGNALRLRRHRLTQKGDGGLF